MKTKLSREQDLNPRTYQNVSCTIPSYPVYNRLRERSASAHHLYQLKKDFKTVAHLLHKTKQNPLAINRCVI